MWCSSRALRVSDWRLTARRLSQVFVVLAVVLSAHRSFAAQAAAGAVAVLEGINAGVDVTNTSAIAEAIVGELARHQGITVLPDVDVQRALPKPAGECAKDRACLQTIASTLQVNLLVIVDIAAAEPKPKVGLTLRLIDGTSGAPLAQHTETVFNLQMGARLCVDALFENRMSDATPTPPSPAADHRAPVAYGNEPNVSLGLFVGMAGFFFGSNAAAGGFDLALLFEAAPLDMRGWRLGLHLRADGGGFALNSGSDTYFWAAEGGVEISPGIRWLRLDGGYFLFSGGFDASSSDPAAVSYSTSFSGPYVGAQLALCINGEARGRCREDLLLVGFHDYIGSDGAGYLKASVSMDVLPRDGRSWSFEFAGLFGASDNHGNTGGWGLVGNGGIRWR